MIGNRTITINEQDFSEKLAEISCELIDSPIDILKFSVFCGAIHKAFFDEPDENKTESEAPFKVGDKVFVIDNDSDGNGFVNQIVTVKSVCNDHCWVTDGETRQVVDFENLRKVENTP